MLKCRNQLGHISYKCDQCWDVKHIPFTCKSRFCNTCWKVASDLRMNNLLSWRPRGIHYYHLAFTIPEELRSFFKRHREALKILPKVASDSICFYFKKHKLKPWILAVIHTFWAQLNRNPHVHTIATAWGMNSVNQYKQIRNFIPYKQILSSWKMGLLRALKLWINKNLQGEAYTKELKLINFLYAQKNNTNEEKSWYIYFSRRAENFHILARYIGRYLKRPIIAKSRILDYKDWEVMYSYKDKYDNKEKNIIVSDQQFIALLIQHIPNTYFHMVYYYGIFSNRCKKDYLYIIHHFFTPLHKLPTYPKNFSERTWTYIFSCSCWGTFYKWKKFIPGYQYFFFSDP